MYMYSRRQWHPTPVLLPGKSHGQRSLVGCSPWGGKESDTTEQLHFHFSLSCTGEGNGNPLQCSCLENPRDRGTWWAAVYGVAQSQTWLKRLSSSSVSCSVMSDSLRPHGLWPTRLLCSWDSPGKKTRVDCHSLLQCICIYLCNIVSYARESYRAQINFKKTMINQWKKIKC